MAVEGPPTTLTKHRRFSSPIKSPLRASPQRRVLRSTTRFNADPKTPTPVPRKARNLKKDTVESKKGDYIYMDCDLIVSKNACPDHQNCEDFKLDTLREFLSLCNKLSGDFFDHIKNPIMWEQYMDGEDMISEMLKDEDWKDAECKFCYIEYILCYASRHVFLVVLKDLGKIHEYARSLHCLWSYGEDVKAIDEWVTEVVASKNGDKVKFCTP
jgi:hypothetical protein